MFNTLLFLFSDPYDPYNIESMPIAYISTLKFNNDIITFLYLILFMSAPPLSRNIQ